VRKSTLIFVQAAALALFCVPTTAVAQLFIFNETAVTECPGSAYCTQPSSPVGIMWLGTSGGTETGSALYNGLPALGGTFGPMVTDPGFSFSFGGGPVISALDNFGDSNPDLYYDIMWSEIDGILTSVSASAYDDDVGGTSVQIGEIVGGGGGGVGLDGGWIGADATIGTCSNGICMVAGYWTGAAPEPGSLALFCPILAGLCVVRLSTARRRHLSA
jgi:hypothetical protein